MSIEDLFSYQGNNEFHEGIKNLRLAVITSVNTEDMVAEIEFLGESSGRTRVPLPMPMAYPGGGIYAVPSRGAIVVVGLRAMQFPLILAYYPSNTHSPDSFFSIWKQKFGMPENLSEGDIFIRTKADSAKCDLCNTVSPEVSWESDIDPHIGMERCPNCKEFAYVLDEEGYITKANKRPLGMTLAMKADSTLLLQASNVSESGLGDRERLFKLAIDGKTGEVSVDGLMDFHVSSRGAVAFMGQEVSILATDKILEQAVTRVSQINANVVETSAEHSIDASKTFQLTGRVIAITAGNGVPPLYGGALNLRGPLVTLKSDSTLTTTSDKSVDTAGPLVRTAASEPIARAWETRGTWQHRLIGDELRTVAGSVSETIAGTLIKTVTGVATETYSSVVKTVTGSVAETYGSEVKNVTGVHSLIVGGACNITSTGVMTLLAATTSLQLSGLLVSLNGAGAPGSRGVSRIGDEIKITPATDPTFMSTFPATGFLSVLVALLQDLVGKYDTHTHIGGTGIPNLPFIVPPPGLTAPEAITGIITTGNAAVKA